MATILSAFDCTNKLLCNIGLNTTQFISRYIAVQNNNKKHIHDSMKRIRPK